MFETLFYLIFASKFLNGMVLTCNEKNFLTKAPDSIFLHFCCFCHLVMYSFLDVILRATLMSPEANLNAEHMVEARVKFHFTVSVNLLPPPLNQIQE